MSVNLGTFSVPRVDYSDNTRQVAPGLHRCASDGRHGGITQSLPVRPAAGYAVPANPHLPQVVGGYLGAGDGD